MIEHKDGWTTGRSGYRTRKQRTPGRASDYIEHFEELVRRKVVKRGVLYGRVAGRTQDYTGNLTGQMDWLRKWVRHYGIPIVAEFKDVGSGWKIDRGRLRGAASFDRRSGTVVVAESTDRFIRSEDYHSQKNPSAQPTIDEFEALKLVTQAAVLATILNPDTPWKEVRSHQSKRGQSAKGRKGDGGRKPGWRKRRRAKLQPEARRLRRKGLSYRKIGKRLRVSSRTAWEWAKRT